jgi:hypothetical protein
MYPAALFHHGNFQWQKIHYLTRIPFNQLLEGPLLAFLSFLFLPFFFILPSFLSTGFYYVTQAHNPLSYTSRVLGFWV